MTCAQDTQGQNREEERLVAAHVIEDGRDENGVAHEPLAVDVARIRVTGPAKEEGARERATMASSVAEGGVQVGHQLVAQPQSVAPGLRHFRPPVELLHTRKTEIMLIKGAPLKMCLLSVQAT